MPNTDIAEQKAFHAGIVAQAKESGDSVGSLYRDLGQRMVSEVFWAQPREAVKQEPGFADFVRTQKALIKAREQTLDVHRLAAAKKAARIEIKTELIMKEQATRLKLCRDEVPVCL